MPEPLALETAVRVRDVGSDRAKNETCTYVFGQRGVVECQDEVSVSFPKTLYISSTMRCAASLVEITGSKNVKITCS